jgi:Uma2 family endonuclease
MTFEEYLEWESQQEELWELVDGYPVLRSERWERDPVTGMAGTTVAHNLIVVNLLRHLGNRLAGSNCRPMASHLKHRSVSKTARYPDASIDCGRPEMGSLEAAEPRVIFEVISKSNTMAQQMLLLADYQAIASVRHIAFIEQARPSVVLWTRNVDGWRAVEVVGLDAALDLSAVGVSLPMAELYEGVSFEIAVSDG